MHSLDTCNHVAHSRTHPYRLNQLVGFSSQMDANRETAKSNGKPLDRDLTHTGLHVHHSTLIQPTCIKSSLDSSSPDTTITSIHQQNPVRPETDASSANQDHQETQEVSPQDITDGSARRPTETSDEQSAAFELCTMVNGPVADVNTIALDHHLYDNMCDRWHKRASGHSRRITVWTRDLR